MPLNPISIIIVQNCHARLGFSVELDLLSVVRLLPWWSEPSSWGPVLESRAVCWRHRNLVCMAYAMQDSVSPWSW